MQKKILKKNSILILKYVFNYVLTDSESKMNLVRISLYYYISRGLLITYLGH